MGSNCSKKKEQETKKPAPVQKPIKKSPFIKKIKMFKPLKSDELNSILKLSQKEKNEHMAAYNNALTYLLLNTESHYPEM